MDFPNSTLNDLIALARMQGCGLQIALERAPGFESQALVKYSRHGGETIQAWKGPGPGAEAIITETRRRFPAMDEPHAHPRRVRKLTECSRIDGELIYIESSIEFFPTAPSSPWNCGTKRNSTSPSPLPPPAFGKTRPRIKYSLTRPRE